MRVGSLATVGTLLHFVVRLDILKHYLFDIGGGLPTGLDLVSRVVISIFQDLGHIVLTCIRCMVELRAVVVVSDPCYSVSRHFLNILLPKTRLWTTCIKPIILVHAES